MKGLDKNLNISNKLTVMRIALIPFCIYFLAMNSEMISVLISLVIFIVASITDFFDGYLARKYNMITDFGKLMDPLADKLLVLSVLIAFIDFGVVPSFVVMLIVAREFAVTSLRLIATANGKILAADKWGKIKTVCQMLFIVFAYFKIAGFEGVIIDYSYIFLLYAMTLLTVVSGLNYFWKNREIFLSDC